MPNNKIIGPALPPGLCTNQDSEDGDDSSNSVNKEQCSGDEDFGPALPPGYKKTIGPSLPAISTQDDGESDEDVYGPARPGEADLNHQYDASQRLSRVSKDETQREKWMLEPPTVLRKTLPTQSVTKFNQKSSSRKPIALTKEQKLELEMLAQKDEKNKDFLKKYEKDHKRNVSLLDQHRDQLKSKKPKTERIERREFDRDKDLNTPRDMDGKLKKAFINDASSAFGTRFSSGRFEKFL